MQNKNHKNNHKITSESYVTKSSEKILEYRILHRINTIA